MVGALPLNGGAYNALLNTTSKTMASLAATLTLLSYMATAVISASEAMHYLHGIIPSLPVILATICLLALFLGITIMGIGESSIVAQIIFVFHLFSLVLLTGAISIYLQLIAGRTAQEHNQRKNRKGAFWEDRYHATAIETDNHLHRCITYIDLNMVRAGKVKHPSLWPFSGYHEIQHPPSRYALIDRQALMTLCGFSNGEELSLAHRQWIEEALGSLAAPERQTKWSQSVAVGSEDYLEAIKGKLILP